MANREIKIHIAADANLAALREVNTQLAKMAMDVGRKNGDLRQATMLAAREYFNLGDASEKAATRAVLSAKQIEEAWRKAMTKPTDEGCHKVDSGVLLQQTRIIRANGLMKRSFLVECGNVQISNSQYPICAAIIE